MFKICTSMIRTPKKSATSYYFVSTLCLLDQSAENHPIKLRYCSVWKHRGNVAMWPRGEQYYYYHYYYYYFYYYYYLLAILEPCHYCRHKSKKKPLNLFLLPAGLTVYLWKTRTAWTEESKFVPRFLAWSRGTFNLGYNVGETGGWERKNITSQPDHILPDAFRPTLRRALSGNKPFLQVLYPVCYAGHGPRQI